MAFDEDLADRVRELIAVDPGLTEKRMFGGVGFMVDGHMAVAVTETGLMVRVDPAESAKLVERPGVERMVMRGRELSGWLLVDAGALKTKRALSAWVARGAAFARTLPPKGGRRRR